jgi:hypothetical protein
MSWPVSVHGHSYQVCLSCGAKRLFDEKTFSAYGAYRYDLNELIAPEKSAKPIRHTMIICTTRCCSRDLVSDSLQNHLVKTQLSPRLGFKNPDPDKDILAPLLGGAAVHRCDNCILLTATLVAAGGRASAPDESCAYDAPAPTICP